MSDNEAEDAGEAVEIVLPPDVAARVKELKKISVRAPGCLGLLLLRSAPPSCAFLVARRPRRGRRQR